MEPWIGIAFAGVRKRGWVPRDRLKKEAIVGHGVVNARRGDDKRGQTSHQADDDNGRKHHAAGGPEQHFTRLGHEGLVRSDFLEGTR